MIVQSPEVVTPEDISEIHARVLSFKKLVHILHEKQEKGKKLDKKDLSEFQKQVQQIIVYDFDVLIGVIDGLVEDGDIMVSLLHEVASAKREDFPEMQDKIIQFLSTVNFDA